MKKKEVQRGYLSSLIGETTPSKMAGVSYSALVCVYCVVVLVVQLVTAGIVEPYPQWYVYLSWSIASIAFAITSIWYFSFTKTSLKAFLKEQKCAPKYYLVALFLQIGLFFLAELNALFLSVLEKFGYQIPAMPLPSTDGFGLVGVLFAVAVLPAVFEEIFFRGILLREMKEFSIWTRVLLCGAFFALYHQNPAQTVYQFCCGAGYALLVAKAGSFLPLVFSHFLNNALIIVLSAKGITSFEGGTYAFILIFSALCLVGTTVYLFVFDKKGGEKTPTKKGAYKEFFTYAALGSVVFGLTWLLGLIGS